MSNAVATIATTNTVGYYNPARWPVQITISKLNITLTLKPREYILDRLGRMVNDPFFDVYVANRQLHRETSDRPVPLMLIPAVKPMETATGRTNPVQTVTNWKRDGTVIKQPTLSVPAAEPAAPIPAMSADSVTPMSMDEAYKRGFAKRSRVIPDDYGAPETTGLPPRNIPPMRVAIDPTMNRVAKPLPAGMLDIDKSDPNRHARTRLVSNLGTAAARPQAESVRQIISENTSSPFGNTSSPFGNTTTAATDEGSPLVSGAPPAPAAELESEAAPEPEQQPVVPETAPVESQEPTSVLTPDEQAELNEVLPAPDLTEAVTPVAETSTPPVIKPVARKAPPAAPAAASTGKFACMECGGRYPFRIKLLTHVKTMHPDKEQVLMGPYPG